jgi:hypothetical protein
MRIDSRSTALGRRHSREYASSERMVSCRSFGRLRANGTWSDTSAPKQQRSLPNVAAFFLRSTIRHGGMGQEWYGRLWLGRFIVPQTARHRWFLLEHQCNFVSDRIKGLVCRWHACKEAGCPNGGLQRRRNRPTRISNPSDTRPACIQDRMRRRKHIPPSRCRSYPPSATTTTTANNNNNLTTVQSFNVHCTVLTCS